ncbi:MAG TPA: acyl-CoA reductase [Bacteroidia bacterium]|nr:acyl-CoA reductase [Bacteroidia bacterium]
MTEEIVKALVKVGRSFGNKDNAQLQQAMESAWAHNKWFTAENVQLALDYWHSKLTAENLQKWMEREGVAENTAAKTVGIVAAGNIPMVSLHDVVCVLLTGNRVNIKLSSDDEVLMKFFIRLLVNANPLMGQYIQAVDKIENIDAVIATGSNNTARYFQYYFGKYPNIIRKNRNSIAVLTGNETPETLHKIGFDITSYFGKGCRNVTQVWAPEGYNWEKFIVGISGYNDIINHNKYANNYTYHKAIILMNLDKHLDTGFILLRNDRKIYSPLGVLNYTEYKDMGEVKEFIAHNADNIQCIVSESPGLLEAVKPGNTQNPELWEYADGVNTIKFLKGL